MITYTNTRGTNVRLITSTGTVMLEGHGAISLSELVDAPYWVKVQVPQDFVAAPEVIAQPEATEKPKATPKKKAAKKSAPKEEAKKETAKKE